MKEKEREEQKNDSDALALVSLLRALRVGLGADIIVSLRVSKEGVSCIGAHVDEETDYAPDVVRWPRPLSADKNLELLNKERESYFG